MGDAQRRPRPDQPLRATEQAPGAPLLQRARQVAEAALVDRRQRELGGHRARLDPRQRPARGMAGGQAGGGQRQPRRRRPGGGRGSGEDRPEEQPAARPHRHGGRGEQDAGVGAEVGADGRPRGAQAARRARAAEQIGADGRGHQVREAEQGPGAHRHRRARLDDAQHVVEALGPAEVGDEQGRRGGDGAERYAPGDARRAVVADEVAGQRGKRRARRGSAEPEVERDLPGPHRRLDDRPVDLPWRRAGARRASGVGDESVRRRAGRRVLGVGAVEKRPARVGPVGAVQRDALARALPRGGLGRRAQRGRHVALAAHRLRPRTKVSATPAAAASPAPTPASVAGTTLSWIGESAWAGSP